MGRAHQGNGFPLPLPVSSTGTQIPVEALRLHSNNPAPCRHQNKPFFVVSIRRQRFWGDGRRQLGKDSIFLVSIEFWITRSSWRLFCSVSFPQGSHTIWHYLCPWSSKGVRHSDSESFTEGKGLRENSICVHTLMAWILHYLFQQINVRPDQSIKYRDNIDLSGAICQLQNASCPFLPVGSRRMLLFH